jgi:hypothetical protein
MPSNVGTVVAHVRPCRVVAPRSDERANGRDAATWANVARMPSWQGGAGRS